MKHERGFALLEVVIFLILLCMGYIGWMNQKKSVAEVDYELQLSRSLCYYRELFSSYIQQNKNSITAGTVSFSALGIEEQSGYPSGYPGYQVEFHVTNNLDGYILLLKEKQNNVSSFDDDYQIRSILNASLGIFSVPPYPLSDDNILYGDHIDSKMKTVSVYNNYYKLSGVDLSGYDIAKIMAIVVVPEKVTPFQECYNGF